MRKLKTTEVAATREELRASQGCLCGLCKLSVSASEAVLDHDHGTGAVRGVLHRSCNALLGKVENGIGRFGVRNVGAFGAGLGPYLTKHKTNMTGLLHPSHKTPDEKRLARNAKARKARAAKKAA